MPLFVFCVLCLQEVARGCEAAGQHAVTFLVKLSRFNRRFRGVFFVCVRQDRKSVALPQDSIRSPKRSSRSRSSKTDLSGVFQIVTGIFMYLRHNVKEALPSSGYHGNYLSIYVCFVYY